MKFFKFLENYKTLFSKISFNACLIGSTYCLIYWIYIVIASWTLVQGPFTIG